MWVKKTIGEQRKILATLFEPSMLNLSKLCTDVWSDMEKLDGVLSEQFSTIPHCHLIYAIDKFGKQVSSNVSAKEIDPSYRGQDLSRRPYSVSLYPKRHFMLSSVYISQMIGKPCISTVQPVIDEQQFLGFIVADFDIQQLPLSISIPKTTPLIEQSTEYANCQQFSNQRINTLLDRHIDDLEGILARLICEQGVFHCMIHYASGQIILWQLDDPYQYRLYTAEQLLGADMYFSYPRHAYPEKAALAKKQVLRVLERLNILRVADDKVYLRTASLNIMNAMVGLTFSCEGTQYLPAPILLEKNLSYWLGREQAVNAN